MLAEAREVRCLGSVCGDGVRSVGGVLECGEGGHNKNQPNRVTRSTTTRDVINDT